MSADAAQNCAGVVPMQAVPVNAAPVNAVAVSGTVAPHSSEALHAACRENEQLKRQLAAVTRELESFTYSVSHDLRASLRHISAFVEIVNEDLGGHVNAGVASHLTTITQAAQRMTRMIDALMALSRLGHIDLVLSRVAMGPLIAEVFESLERGPGPEAGHQPIQPYQPIQWQIADDFPATLADVVLVRQVWQHLISNAVKFTRAGANVRASATPGASPSAISSAAKVQIGWHLPGDGLCEMFVKDNGVGFNPKFRAKLFQVFQRLHSASAFEGIGMGLALSRRIVERHGGSIDAKAEVAGGCEVRFTLPLADRA